MLTHLYEVLCTSIGKEIDPFLRVKDGSCEVLNEVIVHHIWAIGVKVVFPGLVFGIGPLVEVPPIPFGI
jgi:hypothetical protein